MRPDGALWFTNSDSQITARYSIGRITTAGAVTSYTANGITNPIGITTGSNGALWFTNSGNSIGQVTTPVTPRIISVNPKSGAVGSTVTITGRNLAGATQVAFNGAPATIVSDTGTKIVVTVPAGATKGHVTVMTRAGTATSNGRFRVT